MSPKLYRIHGHSVRVGEQGPCHRTGILMVPGTSRGPGSQHYQAHRRSVRFREQGRCRQNCVGFTVALSGLGSRAGVTKTVDLGSRGSRGLPGPTRCPRSPPEGVAGALGVGTRDERVFSPREVA